MWLMRFCRLSVALGLAVLAIFSGAPQTSAESRAQIEIVPHIPHSDQVYSLAFSPDGSRLLSGSYDKTMKLWDVGTGALLRTFADHSRNVTSVAFSPDGSRVVSASATMKMWDVASGALLRTFDHISVVAVAFSPDGSHLLTGTGGDRTVQLWDAGTGALVRTFKGHSHWVTSVAFSPDGSRVLSGSDDKTMKLWDARTGALLRTFDGHSDKVTSVAFSPDGSRLLSGSHDGTTKLWDVGTGALIRTFEVRSEPVFLPVFSVAFSPDGNHVLSGGKLWDAATGALVRTFDGGGSSSVAFSPDGSRALSDAGSTLRLWDATSGALLRTFEGRSQMDHPVAFSPDGSRILSGGSRKKTAVNTTESTAKLWDAATGALVRTFEGHQYFAVTAVAFSPDSRRMLSGSVDKTIKLWDVAAGALVRTFEGHSGTISSVAFSPDGGRVLSGSDDATMKLWDAATGDVVLALGHLRWVQSVAFSPDGTRLLSGSSDKTMKLWDAATGALVRTYEADSTVTSVAFSPDGSRVLSGSYDTTAKLWDVATGALIRTFEGHSNAVASVAFSPDGGRVLSGSWDRTMKLWDVGTGALVRSFEGHSDNITSVAFSPDGRRVLSGSLDTTVRIWDATTGAQLVTIIGGPADEWLSITPTGFFASTGEANKPLAVVRGLEVTTIDQVHQSLFNPDLVREALAGDPSGELREAAKVINLEKVLDSGPAPVVAITSPAEGSQSESDLVAVTARIEDRGKGVGRIEWRVNGITAAVTAKPPGDGSVYTIRQQLALDPGDSTIEVVAYNANNLLASLPARTTIKFTRPVDKAKPNLHILAIGINTYVDREWAPPLDLAVKDAMAFGANMRKAAAGLYAEVRVNLALDKDATRDNLEGIIDKLSAEVNPRDSFILFAAGHGTSENGRFYFIPQDYQSGPGNLAGRAIGQDRLQDWLANRIKAKRAIILLDTCESGALIAGHARSRADAPASEAAVGRLHEATGRPVLTAAAAGQFAHEGLIGITGERHGVFTLAVVDALRKGDTNGNGTIELSELVRHVQTVVPKIAADMGGAGRAATSEPVWSKQAARFGSRGEDFAVAQRLP